MWFNANKGCVYYCFLKFLKLTKKMSGLENKVKSNELLKSTSGVNIVQNENNTSSYSVPKK